MCIPSTTTFVASREFSARRALCDSSVDYNSEDFRDRKSRRDWRDATVFSDEFSHRPRNDLSSFGLPQRFTSVDSCNSDCPNEQDRINNCESRFSLRSRAFMCDHRDDDFRSAAFAQDAGGFVRGSPRGQHVIDENDGLTGQIELAAGLERAAYIRPAFGDGAFLEVRVLHTPQRARQASQLQSVCHRSGQNFTLIITATPAPAPMERDRNRDIRLVRLQFRREMASEHRRERLGEHFAAGMFAAQDDRAVDIVVRTKSNDGVEREVFRKATGADICGRGRRGDGTRAAWANGIGISGQPC